MQLFGGIVCAIFALLSGFVIVEGQATANMVVVCLATAVGAIWCFYRWSQTRAWDD